jgi:hypothetical protein
MYIEEINLLTTTDYGPYILPEMYRFYAQAAAVCFEHNGFHGKVTLNIEGTIQATFNLTWEPVSQQVKDMHDDWVYAAEQGAYCIALLMIHRLTDYKIIRQAKRQTGFDYWLGDKKEAYPYTEKARLEVSGLLKGKLKQINWRVKSKFQQSEQSNELRLPIYVMITEFSKPISKMLEK